jgi:hypothetical protein
MLFICLKVILDKFKTFFFNTRLTKKKYATINCLFQKNWYEKLVGLRLYNILIQLQNQAQPKNLILIWVQKNVTKETIYQYKVEDLSGTLWLCFWKVKNHDC